jgi:predicted SAM-dependent methyltransferase
MNLDVGCGERKRGDINVDIKEEVKPDIVCDIHFLPFKNKQFDTVYCYHVLEHKGVNPIKAIKELQRVCKGRLEIQVPHWLSSNAKKDKTHINFQVMHVKFWKQLNFKTKIDYAHVLNLFFLFIMRPNNLTAWQDFHSYH